MPLYWFPAGIRFKDYIFSEPVPLAGWHAPDYAGIAVVLARNPHWGPKPLQPLSFGDISELPPNIGRNDLLISVLPVPYSTAAQRRALCCELMSARFPVSTGEVARKLDALEARQQEQGERILSLLTFIAKFFEPQPVGPRNTIGFLSQLAPAEATESGS
jgi:hypothetical protein